ncbi:MAG: PKD domain-containing protein [Flavobacteriaceae bacterium]|nr:PKD domain-containing protein [Flavobacteriaceae bacterium]
MYLKYTLGLLKWFFINGFLVLLVPYIAIAQFPQANFIVSKDNCKNETIEISNLSTNSTRYIWDFCEGDLFQSPTFQNIGLIDGSFNPKAFDVAHDGSNWYGFITSKTTNSLFRVEFGESLDNPVPEILDLGNIGGLLSGPEPIKIVNELGNWYAFIINGSNSTLLRLSFGTSLENSPNVQLVLSGISTFNSGFDIAEPSSQKVLVASNFSTNVLTMVNFGNSYSNNPLLTDIITSLPVGGATGSGDIKLMYNEGLWYGFLLTPNSKKIFRLDYGSNLFSIPISTDITGEILGTEFAFGIDIARDKGEFLGFIQTSSGKLIRVYFGKDITNNSPTSSILGDFGVLQNSIGFKLVKEKSEWHAFTIDTSNKILFKGKFPNECSASSSISKMDLPTNISYSTQGKKFISLLSINDFNEFSYYADSTTISPTLAPQLTSQITGNCLSNLISFSGQQLSGNITSWNWDFGDGSGTSTLQDANYAYASAGEYQIKLSVTDANGCSNLLIDTVQVYEEPIPSFTLPGGSLCMNNPVLFTNTTTGETGPSVTWTWDFNGEGSSNEQEPTFTFLTAGSKTITLTSSIPGCANVTQQTINIEEAPTTSFSFNNTCNGTLTTFTDQTTGTNLTSWNWNFGDGTNSTDQNPTQNYAAPGKYIVTLTVANSLGCSTTKVDTVYSHSIPVVSFSNDLPCSTSPIQFTDQSLVDNANMVAWEWNFGDGTTSTDQNPQHLFGQTGDFLVSLRAFSQFGCFSNTQSIVSVAQGPEVDFEWDKSCQGEVTSFIDLTNSFGVAITDWTWIIDGVLFTSQNPTYTFNSSGTYTVQLTVTGVNLCAQTLTQDIIVEVPPIVQFDYNEGCGSSGTEFYDLTNQTGDTIIAREWRVDGAVFSTDSVATTQLTPGNYAITLSVVTTAGCEEVTTQNISLVGSPFANFATNTNFGAAPLTINFANLSTGGNTYLWSFDDANNSTSTEQNPSFTFEEIGLYTVSLQTASDPTCYDEFTQQIEVVESSSSGEIIGVTSIAVPNGDKTNFIITIENSGTSIIDQTSSLVFRADYGAEVVEPINTQIYAGNTINYTASFALASSSSTQNLCVELRNPSAIQLDRECIILTANVVISEPYPNPSSGLVNIDVLLEDGATVNVRLINRAGQPVLTNSFEGVIGLNKITIDGNGLPQGLYIVEVNAGGKTEKFKTSIVR